MYIYMYMYIGPKTKQTTSIQPYISIFHLLFYNGIGIYTCVHIGSGFICFGSYVYMCMLPPVHHNPCSHPFWVFMSLHLFSKCIILQLHVVHVCSGIMLVT